MNYGAGRRFTLSVDAIAGSIGRRRLGRGSHVRPPQGDSCDDGDESGSSIREHSAARMAEDRAL